MFTPHKLCGSEFSMNNFRLDLLKAELLACLSTFNACTMDLNSGHDCFVGQTVRLIDNCIRYSLTAKKKNSSTKVKLLQFTLLFCNVPQNLLRTFHSGLILKEVEIRLQDYQSLGSLINLEFVLILINLEFFSTIMTDKIILKCSCSHYIYHCKLNLPQKERCPWSWSDLSVCSHASALSFPGLSKCC